jgi:N-methylhydantoinase B
VNAIDLEIYWNRLISIVDEAGAALMRTSFSTVVRESNDFSVVLLDAEGRLVAQSSWSVPGFIGTAPLSLQKMLDKVPKSNLSKGDVLCTNDPWIGTGHLPDLTMAAPLFHKDRLVAFVVTVSHLSDIGGRLWSADASEVYEEGLRLPLLKLVSRGITDHLVLDILDANVRTPAQVRGDIDAQLSAIHVAGTRLSDMLHDYGMSDIDAVAEAIFAASEKAARTALATMPPGVYFGSARVDGWNDPLQIRVRVTVQPEGIEIDYSGSSEQVGFGINETYNHTYAYTLYPLKCMLSPSVPNNDGFTRLFKVVAPEGSIVNATSPAAVGARHLVGHVLQAAIYDALASAVPDRVQADSGTPLWTILLRGVDAAKGESFSSILFFNGGMGAMQGREGRPAISFPANISNTPIEVAENQAPILFRSKRLDETSGGKGASRGGLGQIVSFQSRWPGVMKVSLLTDRVNEAPQGLLGGGAGKPGSVRLNAAPVEHAKGRIDLAQGDVLELCLPGGGGYGTPEASPKGKAARARGRLDNADEDFEDQS